MSAWCWQCKYVCICLALWVLIWLYSKSLVTAWGDPRMVWPLLLVFNHKFEKVIWWSLVMPYGTPPGALNLYSPHKCLGEFGGLFRCCTQTSLSAADKRHWTRSHYLDLCQCFGEELDAICQPLPRLNIFGTQLRVQQTTENRKIYGYLCSELLLYI